MSSWIKQRLALPNYTDENDARLAKLVYVIIVISLLITPLLGTTPWLLSWRTETFSLGTIATGILSAMALQLSLLMMLRRGYVKLVRYLFISSLGLAILLAAAWIDGGISGAIFPTYFIVIMATGFSMHGRAALIATAFGILGGAILVAVEIGMLSLWGGFDTEIISSTDFSEINGTTTIFMLNPYWIWALYSLGFILAGGIIYVIAEHLHQSYQHLDKNKQEHAEITQKLEQEITERKRRESDQDVIVTLSAAMRTAPTRVEIISTILRELLYLMNAGGSALAIVDSENSNENGELFVELGLGVWSNWTGKRLPSYIYWEIPELRDGEVYHSNDAQNDPNCSSHGPILYNLNGMEAIACVPLKAQNKTVGMLYLGRAAGFNDEDTRLLTAISDLVANALQRIQLHKQTQQRAEQLAAINKLGQFIAETLELPQIYAEISKATHKLLPGISTLLISLYNPETDSMESYQLHPPERSPNGHHPDDTGSKSVQSNGTGSLNGTQPEGSIKDGRLLHGAVVHGTNGLHPLRPVYAVHERESVDIERLLQYLMNGPGSAIREQAVQTRQPLSINNLSNQSGATPISVPSNVGQSRWSNLRLRSAACAPMIARGEVVGLLEVQSHAPNRFGKSDLELLTLLANTAAISIKNTLLFENLQQSNQKLSEVATSLEQQNAYLATLHETTFSLMNRLALPDLLKAIVTRAAQLCDTEHGYIHLREGDGIVEVKVGVGIFQDQIGFRLRRGQGVAGKVLERGETIIVDDYERWPERYESDNHDINEQWSNRLHAIIGVPLRSGTKVVGVIGVAYADPGSKLTHREVDLMNRFAELASIALDNAQLYTAVQQELTERKQAEATARKHLLAMEASVDGIALLEEGRHIYLNDAYAQIYGYQNPEELLGQPWEVVYSLEERTRVEREILPFLDNEGHWRGESVGRRRDGSTFPQENSLTLSETGELVCVIRDITERRKTEEAWRQSQKLESLGVLAGGIAHDFNNLLTAMMGQNSLAKAKLPGDSPARKHIEKSITSAERAADLTRQMLAYAGKGQFEVGPLNLNKLILQNTSLLETAFPKQVQLSLQLSSDLPMIEADKGQIQQVVMNLVINAAESIKDEGGCVTVETHDVNIPVNGSQNGHFMNQFSGNQFIGGEPLAPGTYISLQVTDTGSGMDRKTIERIFDPFFSTKEQGRGLGLSATLGIIRTHSGGLQVESHPHRGSTFRVFFPTIEQPMIIDNEQSETQPESLVGTVLVIDDEEPIRDAVQDILEIAGMEVISAGDGHQGIEMYMAHREKIGVILLDMQMPVMNGEETLQELRKLDPNIKVILSSGYSETEFAVSVNDNVLFLQKPYAFEQLIAKVNEALGNTNEAIPI